MDYLTPSKLVERAPAAARLREDATGKIDTAAFLALIAKRGYRPVFATQGTSHADAAYPETKGRHLVVAANSGGHALAILNSHTVHRKAWIGAGFAETGESPAFVLGAALPLQRWKGVEGPLKELDAYWPALYAGKEGMRGHSMSPREMAAFARAYAVRAYLPGHKAVSSGAILPPPGIWDPWGLMFHMLRQVLAGNLPSAGAERRVKPIKGPDAIFQAASAAFACGVEQLRRSKRLEVPLNFPRFQKT